MKRLICIAIFAVTFVSATEKKTLTPAQHALRKGNHVEETTHTISEILSGGRIIVLDDGSKWEVAPSGVDKSGGWLGPADVKLRYIGTKNYPYQIYNSWTKSKVMARKFVEKKMKSDGMSNSKN